jgi:hypothetical protein
MIYLGATMKFKLFSTLIVFNLMALPVFASIDGTYSSNHKHMKCTGSWSHPFIPLDGKLDFGTPSDALLRDISSKVSITTEHDGVTISLTDVKGRERKVKLTEGKNKSIRLKLDTDSIVISQNRLAQHNWDYGMYLGSVLNQRFKAVLRLNANNDLILENFDATGVQKLRLGKKCVLPRIN